MMVRIEPLWEEGEEGALKGWRACVEYPSGREECFEVRQLFIDGELERDPAYTVYFILARAVRVAGEDEVDIETSR